MEDATPSPESGPISIAEISFEPVPAGPAPHSLRTIDPRVVADHFAPLLPPAPSAEERWQEKTAYAPFPGI